MNILSTHTTGPRLSVAATADGKTIEEIVLEPDRRHLENIAPAILELSRRTKMRPSDFDIFAAAIGPGSFSGIRIGLSVVKGLALGLGKPVMGFSSLELLAWGASHTGSHVCAVIDARRDELYACVYGFEKERPIEVTEPTRISIGSLKSFTAHYDSDIVLAGAETLLERLSFGRAIPMDSTAASCGRAVFRCLNAGESGTGPHELKPLYLRRSDAEEKSGRHMAASAV
jgi:tRNA threonylcarbamoyladenosine biosynthesis protein TsaB